MLLDDLEPGEKVTRGDKEEQGILPPTGRSRRVTYLPGLALNSVPGCE